MILKNTSLSTSGTVKCEVSAGPPRLDLIFSTVDGGEDAGEITMTKSKEKNLRFQTDIKLVEVQVVGEALCSIL